MLLQMHVTDATRTRRSSMGPLSKASGPCCLGQRARAAPYLSYDAMYAIARRGFEGPGVTAASAASQPTFSDTNDG